MKKDFVWKIKNISGDSILVPDLKVPLFIKKDEEINIHDKYSYEEARSSEGLYNLENDPSLIKTICLTVPDEFFWKRRMPGGI